MEVFSSGTFNGIQTWLYAPWHRHRLSNGSAAYDLAKVLHDTIINLEKGVIIAEW